MEIIEVECCDQKTRESLNSCQKSHTQIKEDCNILDWLQHRAWHNTENLHNVSQTRASNPRTAEAPLELTRLELNESLAVSVLTLSVHFMDADACVSHNVPYSQVAEASDTCSACSVQ